MVTVILITVLFTGTHHNILIIGGEYSVRKGEIVHGNLGLAFAQVTLEENSLIEGKILSLSSAVDVIGSVEGNISSIESDIKLEPSARIKVISCDKGVFPYVILLPQMARWNLSYHPEYK